MLGRIIDPRALRSAKRRRVYSEAEDLAVLVYELARRLPIDERYGLASQMRRAAVSIGSNIAEGCGRDGNPELLRFLRIALGSATELGFQLGLVQRMSLAAPQLVRPATSACTGMQRMLTRLIIRRRPATETSRGRP
jgi:four helix bundle protein